VQAGDRLLADVAALGEADGALVDSGFGGDRRLGHLGPVARPARLDAENLGRLLAHLDRPGLERGRPGLLGPGGGDDQVDPQVGRRRPPAALQLAVGVLGPEGSRARGINGPGADQRQDRVVSADVLEGRVAPDPVHVEVPPRPLRCHGLGVDPERVGRQPQHPHVRLHVALAVEQGGVAALTRRQRLDVVGELALEVVGGLGAGDEEHAALGAVDQSSALAERPVLAVELHRRRSVHASSLRPSHIFRYAKISIVLAQNLTSQ
jgi:hypothetical protein